MISAKALINNSMPTDTLTNHRLNTNTACAGSLANKPDIAGNATDVTAPTTINAWTVTS
jgi:hypothetical protein